MNEKVSRFRRITRPCIFFLTLIMLSACDNPSSLTEIVNKPTNGVANIPFILDGNFKYVAVNGGIEVYDMDRGHTAVKTIPMPEMSRPRGIAANAITNRLYIPYWGSRTHPKTGRSPVGFVVCMDLTTDRILWTQVYEPSIDSLAMTPDGKTLYMPSGEESEEGGFWFVIDALTGKEKSRIPVYKGAHNTIVSRTRPRVYLGSLQSNFLYIANTETNQIIEKIGPFGERIRPLAINGHETLAFVTINFLSGFEVADLESGKVIHHMEVKGFPWVDPPLPYTQSHGIALSPDEKEVWVVDAFHRYVHVFDVRGLPQDTPRQIADIEVRDQNDPWNLPKWINFSRDGRYVHVSTGAIIDTKSRRIMATVVPSKYYMEIHFENGDPVQAYSRYGIGYVRSEPPKVGP